MCGSAVRRSMFFCVLLAICAAVRIRYISTEHPAITYNNPKYIQYANISSRRHSRQDPFYYVDMHLDFTIIFGNNLTVHFYFYEFLSNEYKRGFIEMHFGFCDLVHKDKFFGHAMKQGKLNQPCPYPPGLYSLYNMTIPLDQIPRSFPFRKGRIYCNATLTNPDLTIVAGYINMEVKEAHINRNKKN